MPWQLTRVGLVQFEGNFVLGVEWGKAGVFQVMARGGEDRCFTRFIFPCQKEPFRICVAY